MYIARNTSAISIVTFFLPIKMASAIKHNFVLEGLPIKFDKKFIPTFQPAIHHQTSSFWLAFGTKDEEWNKSRIHI